MEKERESIDVKEDFQNKREPELYTSLGQTFKSEFSGKALRRDFKEFLEGMGNEVAIVLITSVLFGIPMLVWWLVTHA